jgi:hypothetical protein
VIIESADLSMDLSLFLQFLNVKTFISDVSTSITPINELDPSIVVLTFHYTERHWFVRFQLFHVSLNSGIA